jgi:LacI family transcriptional regulator
MPNTKKSSRGRQGGRTGHITVVDIAKAAGVCQATVSYVINNRPGVGPELRRRIEAIMKSMNFTPKPAARHLSMSKSDMIGVVVQDLAPGWFLSIFHGMLWRAMMNGYHAITVVSAKAGDEEELPARLVARASVDGLLWLDPRVTTEMASRFRKKGLPFVVLQNRIDDPDVNTVATDDRRGAQSAALHLLKLGYRRLVLVTGHPENWSSREKLEGARDAFRELRVALPAKSILNGEYNGPVAVRVLEGYLAKRNAMPRAIFCFNDHMALALLRWLNQRGVRVPEDVALMGYDGTDEARESELTTVETPGRDMGIMAAQLLTDTIRNPERKAQHILLQGALCVRKTCGALLDVSPAVRNA